MSSTPVLEASTTNSSKMFCALPVCLWNIEAYDERENAIFRQISKNMRRCTRFQFDTVDCVYNISWKSARSAGVSICTSPSSILPGQVAYYRCPVRNEASSGKSNRLRKSHLSSIHQRKKKDKLLTLQIVIRVETCCNGHSAPSTVRLILRTHSWVNNAGACTCCASTLAR